MSVGASFYWYDYETFGVDPRRDRPAQFAGLRTDADFCPVSPPLVLYCKPATDYLPSPDACLLTGITPQMAQQSGVPEAEFIAAIEREFAVPGTCVLGYNNLRFDDEVTRHGLYRNLCDPYAREWRNGNSRWDLIDLVRLAQALRPEGIHWPRDDEGRPIFKLEALTAANGIAHGTAHEALSDVQATIALARLVKDRQPKLFDFVFRHRGKASVAALLEPGAMQPVLHVSEKFPAERNCLAVVTALAWHPRNPNGIVVYDLSVDPEPLLTLDADELRDRLFTPAASLPDGVERLPLKTVHTNRCPVLAPMKVLRPLDRERLGIDLSRCYRHLERLKETQGIDGKIRKILEAPAPPAGDPDPDLMLYEGGFLSDRDRATLNHLRTLSPADLASTTPLFQDGRLPEMLFRYRARNYSETLSPAERLRWEQFRIRRLTTPGCGAAMVRTEYESRLRQLEALPDLSARRREIVRSLWEYLGELIP